MTNILSEICKKKRIYVEKQKLLVSEKHLMDDVILAAPTRGFAVKIAQNIRAQKNTLITELKKASPSEGVIRQDFSPAELAKSYEQGGATCLSVLTDYPYFKGKDEYLKQAKSASLLPVLRKDFILDSYQVTESRALGADCILLIMAALDDNQARIIEEAAISLGMDVLIEVHNEQELERALKLSSRLIGINNRDLTSLKIDLGTTQRLVKLIPADYSVICESGIKNAKDIESINEAGVYAFLVGSSLMKFKDVELATKKLLS